MKKMTVNTLSIVSGAALLLLGILTRPNLSKDEVVDIQKVRRAGEVSFKAIDTLSAATSQASNVLSVLSNAKEIVSDKLKGDK